MPSSVVNHSGSLDTIDFQASFTVLFTLKFIYFTFWTYSVLENYTDLLCNYGKEIVDDHISHRYSIRRNYHQVHNF